MSSRSYATTLTLTAVAVAGCDECPPEIHVIRSMRVLGTVAEPPVASPGSTVGLRVVTADVESRDLEVAWYRCARPFQLTPVVPTPGGGGDAGLPFDLYATEVGRCLANGAFARGVSVRVPIDAQGGMRDAVTYRPARRWTDLVGFACAGGSIESPPEGGLWPRCTGSRGVLFTASIPGPTNDGTTTAPPPAPIEALTFGGDARPWTEGVVPEVPRCAETALTCPRWDIRFRVPDSSLVVEPMGSGLGFLGAIDERVTFVGYHVTGSARVAPEVCVEDDRDARITASGDGAARLRWVPPSQEGEVTFWFTTRRFTGGLTVARRTVRVR